MMNIIGRRSLWITTSAVLMILSFAALAVWRLNIGIDFTGGSLVELSFHESRPDRSEIREQFERIGATRIKVQTTGDRGAIVRTASLDQEHHDAVLAAFSGSAEELRYETIGPTIGGELVQKTILAIVLAILAIVLYVAWAFRKVGRELAAWKCALVAIFALLHDVIIPVAVFSLLGKFFDVEIDAAFIAAVLTILGYSVNDTIVVFDRVRENVLTTHGVPFAQVVNESVNQSFARSINTTLTTVLALLAVFIFGGASVRYFALALMIGIGLGAYSSIFIAAPLLVTWHGRTSRV